VENGQPRKPTTTSPSSRRTYQKQTQVRELKGSGLSIDELRALGSVITLEGDDATYPLKIESLEKFTRGGAKKPRVPEWLLLSVQPATSYLPERVVMWVADAYRSEFLKIFEDYLNKKITKAAQDKWETPEGNPANRALVANISRIRQTILDDLWQSDGEPPKHGNQWWELWLDTAQQNTGTLRSFAAALNLRLLERSLALNDRVVVWINATWQQLELLPFTSVPIAEIRKPEFIDTIEDLLPEEQDEYVDDLARRVTAAPAESPAVCHLDTGVARSHRLLTASLDPADLHTVIGTSGFDTQGHGTAMAGPGPVRTTRRTPDRLRCRTATSPARVRARAPRSWRARDRSP
jgi:hypothetical protein